MPTGRPTLLVADDSVTIQKVVTLTFSDEGMDVIAVGNGDDAFQRLEADAPPDIVLADHMMPGLSGYELCRRIKGDSRFRHIPVLLLVGAFEPFNEAEARQAGADEILTKPFQSIRDLVSKVGSLLGGSAPEAEADEPHETTRQTEVATSDASPRTPVHDNVQTSPNQPVAHSDAVAQNEVVAHSDVVVQDEPLSDRHPAFAPNPAASFADLGADDQMIEELPVVNEDDDALERTISVEAPAIASASHTDAAFDDVNTDSTRETDEWGGDQSHSFAAAHVVGEELLAAGQPAFSTHVASAAAADDALLDLGSVNTSLGKHAAEADDFVLDLDDEMPQSPRVARSDTFEHESFAAAEPEHASASSQMDERAFVEPAHGGDVIEPPAPPVFYDDAPIESVPGDDKPVPVEVIEQDTIPQHQVPLPAFGEEELHAPREFIEPTVVPADEPVHADALGDYTDGSVEGDVAKPPASAAHVESLTETMHPALSTSSASEDTAWQNSVSVASATAAGIEQLVSPEQLSTEAIDAIARRAVEMLSEKVVQEIAWEVVPQLAELLIKRRLDEERQK